MVTKKIKNTVIRLEKGDITDMDIEAFVFYARSDLELGSGYGTAILTRGGTNVRKELKNFGTLEVGQVAVTSAGEMKAKYIIHVVGPKFQEKDTETKLRTTMRNALKAAEEKGIQSIAFPPMGSGFYGVPPELCATVMVSEIKKYLGNGSNIKEVVFCVLHTRDFNPLKAQLEALG